MTARRRIEIPSVGVDEYLQLIGSDPFGGSSNVGLRVPTLPTASAFALVPPDLRAPLGQFNSRYLFNGASFSVPEASRVRIIGYRELVTIGCPIVPAGHTVPIVEEFQVTSPVWHFSDASSPSFHLRRLGPPNDQGLPQLTPTPNDLRNFKYLMSDTPALLYKSAAVPAGNNYYTSLTAYVPPNNGRPWGDPLTDGHQGTIYGQNTEWRTANAWRSLDLDVEGPATYAFFISVSQTNPATRPTLAPGVCACGLSPEDEFLTSILQLGGAGAIYWRVGVSLMVEIDSVVSEVRGAIGGENWEQAT